MRRMLLVAMLLASLSARAGELENLVAKYIAWRGGAAYSQMTSLTGEGTAETSGLSGRFSLKQRAGQFEWAHVDLRTIEQTQATTPSDAWTTTLSGQVEDQDPATAQDTRRMLSIDSGRALRGLDGAALKLQPPESVDGAQWSIVRISFGDRDYYDLFIKSTDGSSIGIRAMEDGKKTFRRQDNWRMSGGVRVPYEIRELRETADDNATYKFEKISIGAPIADAVFARPSAPKRVTFEAGAKSTGWVDFEFFQNSRINIPARVNGVTTTVLLDSGAESSVIDAEFAKAAGLRGEGSVAASGTGGQTTVQLVNGVTIEIANLRLHNVTAAIIDLKAIAEAVGHSIPMILGKEILNETVTDIDFPHSRIAFHDPTGFKSLAQARPMQLVVSKGIRAVPISVESRAPILADFDLGNGGCLDLFKAYWESIGLLDGRAQSRGMGGGIGGIREHALTTVRSVEFAGVTLSDVPTSLDLGGEGAFNTDRTRANIGIGVLQRFRLQLDYKNNRIYALADPVAIKQPFPKNRVGLLARFSTTPISSLVVMMVSPNSPAERAGAWKVGDTIVAIDGEALTPELWNAKYWNWTQGKAGSKVILKLTTGESRELVFADFY